MSAQTSEGVPERIWTRTLQKKVARHVQMPRRAQSGVAGNQHPTFSLENSSFEWTRRKAEGARLSQQGERRRKGTKLVTHWRGLGPMMAYNFCQVQHAKPLGQGSGALVNPCKGKDFSDVLTIAIPPIDVWHWESEDEWTMWVSFYLGVLNDNMRFTLPVNANVLYKGQPDPTLTFTQMGLYILGEMCTRYACPPLPHTPLHPSFTDGARVWPDSGLEPRAPHSSHSSHSSHSPPSPPPSGLPLRRIGDCRSL